MKKIIFVSAAALFLPFLAGAATLSNTFNVGTYFPVAGSTTSVSSTCGVSASNSTISFSIIENGIGTSIPTNITTDSTGAFSGSITFPSPYGAGQATLVATCNRTGDTINSPTLTFAAPASTSFGLPAFSPNVGGVYNVSGACGYSNGGGSVQLTLNSNGGNYQLGTASLTPSDTFAYTIVIPSNISTGAATLSATCSNGATFSSRNLHRLADARFVCLWLKPHAGTKHHGFRQLQQRQRQPKRHGQF